MYPDPRHKGGFNIIVNRNRIALAHKIFSGQLISWFKSPIEVVGHPVELE